MKYFVLVSLLTIHVSAAEVCEEWFAKSKLVVDSKDCVLRCAALKVDMSTFDCKSKCDQLCKSKVNKSSSKYSSVIDVAGLTKAEMSLVLKSPGDARKAYKQMELAQEMTQKRFGRDWYDDESDAYRHFVWPGLLIKELGLEKAKKFLDAHESANSVDDASTVMDRENNEIAIKTSEELEKAGKLNAEELDKAAVDALEKNKLKVIRKLGGPKK